MKFLDTVTREGTPRREYRWFQLLLALVPGYVFHLYCTVIGWTLKERSPEFTSFKNAIIVLFHQEFIITLSAQRTWRRHFRQMSYLGIHNWISYVFSVICYLDGLQVVRYDRRTGRKPIDQTLAFLRANPNLPFATRTDSGGPYGKVRSSVVRLAVETNRPIICMRQTVDKRWLVLTHQLPKPFAHVSTSFSAPIPVEKLKTLSIEEATALIQAQMDALG